MIKSAPPLISLIISLFAIGVIAIESIIPASIIYGILYFFFNFNYKYFIAILVTLTLIRAAISHKPKMNIFVKVEE